MLSEDMVGPSILKMLKYNPRGLTVSDIAKKVGINRNSTARHLEVLAAEGKVEVRNYGTAKVYSLAQRIPLSAFLCFTKNMILILDEDMNVVQANDQYLKLAGCTKQGLIGKNILAARLPIVSAPEALAVIQATEKEQVISDIRYQSGQSDLFYQMEVIPTTFEGGETGLTIVLEDITERKKYVKNMEFLARTAMELVDMPQGADIYQYISERIIDLVPGGRVFVFSYDEIKRQFAVRATQDEDFHAGLIRILGRDPVGLVFPLTEVLSSPHGGSPLILLHQGVREFIIYPELGPEGLSFYDLCFRQIPEETCEEILHTWNLGKVYITFLVWGEQVFGDVGIFLPQESNLEDTQVIESFLRQASIAIARRQTEERLRRSEERFKEVVNLSPLPAAIIGSDGRYAFVNEKFTETFGYTIHDIPTGNAWFTQAFPDPIYRKTAIAAWKSDLEMAGEGQVRPRTFDIRCKDGTTKTVLFEPVTLGDGTQYVTYQIVTDPR
ncbi:MAG: PAS domain S-box protein [Methanobacteriota archaeon]|nr:MAG: PAS domain S-box protein [Euryarchaeota archaeon]